ncbi:formate dehydrogenase accessory sulfurtransferase FdhD [Paenibacillus bovis]|uniref:Sulfur carrier protein FdhD n=1 Tax=Paenibacillus bovis TaxID=1616788 RepID=A0A172ZJW4_9BACL|nr:formate dehydrogenase accessory sulfurtransferase FdhD [Paenibacillus bovis]ANF97924.1 sufurtransferase FdhD [Paenibacillus bovis]
MDYNVQQQRSIVRYKRGQFTEEPDTVVSEQPVTIKVNGEEFVTLVCTPEYIEDMTIGFLASEGVIQRYSDIQELWVQEQQGYVHVRTDRWNPQHRQLFTKRYITSCCGTSRQGFVFFNDARTAKKMEDIHVRVSFEQCFQLMDNVQQSAELFQRTGGVHTAALCEPDHILLGRSDIGRHNALDKIYGWCLRHQINMQGKIMVFSGRISSEILTKVSKIGCEVILSKSAPTALALDLADHLGITTVGFVRDDSCNIYTHPQRIREYADKAQNSMLF